MRNYKNYETNKKPADLDKSKQQTACDYSYYSRVLKTPFDSIDELKKAEAEYYAALKLKEDKAATKKADAKKVEDAFKALNSARKSYKETLAAVTHEYSENLEALKRSFEEAKLSIQKSLASAEEKYAAELKAFTEKYPEGYHLTLKDGDFETTIDSKAGTVADPKTRLFTFDDFFNAFFKF
jgi:chromosome segregation ATPase